jgi:RNA polymerase sigma-70 factor, ECF subfamily
MEGQCLPSGQRHPTSQPPVERSISPPDPSRIEAFTQLLATCQRRVFLYALSLLHNAADAEEVLQETNLVLWRKFDQYLPGTDFGRWACRIAQIEVLRFREKRSQAQRLFSQQFIEGLVEVAEQSLDQADDRRSALAHCLGKLRESDRALIARRYQPSATTESVAQAFGRSVQGTRKTLHRIRAALLECIERTLAREDRA